MLRMLLLSKILGKYIVRLFWLGCWRKIYVDDRIPVDKLHHLLLPSLELSKEAREQQRAREGLVEQGGGAEVGRKSRSGSRGSRKSRSGSRGSKKSSKRSSKKGSKRSSVKSAKEAPKVVELWPILLSKALLKIASLSSYGEKEIVDFDILQCLTGCVPQKINTKGEHFKIHFFRYSLFHLY